MKKIFITVFIVILGFNAIAQKINLMTYEATFFIEGVDPIIRTPKYSITIDIDEMKINFNSAYPTYYQLFKSIQEWTDANGVYNIKYEAVDKQNDRCYVTMMKQKKLVNLLIDYGEISQFYKTTIVD
jgi:hypothetical protein